MITAKLCGAVRLGSVMAAMLLGTATALAAEAPGKQYDLWIRGGLVVDGTGAAPRRADVAIRADRIVYEIGRAHV